MNRIINRSDVHNNRQYRIRLKEAVCSCSWCDFGRGENQTGHLAKWGKKVAKKHEYATGKKRNDNKFRWHRTYRGYRICDYYDAHYDEKYKPKPRRKQKMELSRGDARYMLDEYIKHLKRNRNSIADYAAGYLNRDSWGGCTASCGGLSFGYDGRTDDFTLFVSFRRKKPYYRYLSPEE